MQIILTLQAPGAGWHYLVRKLGEPFACSDGETFEGAGQALIAAFSEVKAILRQGQEDGEE